MTAPRRAPSLLKETTRGLITHARQHWLFLLCAALLSLLAFSAIPEAPFHPDESTYLFMSQDWETLLRDPLALAWTPGGAADDLRQRYRLADAPLTRYLLGMGRSLAGRPAPPVDWDWSKSWEDNQRAGALPDPGLLNAGRLFLTLLFPLDLLLIYGIGIRMQGRLTGLLAALLFGLNALVLLHTRRAMAEAALSFGALLAVWSFLQGWRYPWLAGLGVAMAVNSKQTMAGLIPVGLLAVALPQPGAVRRPKAVKVMLNWGQYLLALAAVTFMLNPFLWKHPLAAAQAAWNTRQEVTGRQVADFKRLSPEISFDSPERRLAAMLANLYFAPPAFAEASNYSANTQEAERLYARNPLHGLLRGTVAGGLLFVLSLSGALMALLNLRRASAEKRRALVILLGATLALAASFFALIPLPWQRYMLPLIPFVCLWAAYCVAALAGLARH